MTITYQVETLATCKEGMEALFPYHYDEVAMDKDSIPLDFNWPAYYQLEANGELHILTCRHEGIIVGYHMSIVRPHLHYKSTLMAQTDIFFIKKEHRKGHVGINLFINAEKTLKARGVKKRIETTKLHDSNVSGKSLDMSRLFERLGMRLTEKLYTKLL